MLSFDPNSLHMTGNISWDDHVDRMSLPFGSAHPLPDLARPGCLYGVDPQRDMIGSTIKLYRLCDSAPFVRETVASYRPHYMPYLHSFGISASFAILPMMHFSIDVIKMIETSLISKAFKAVDVGRDTRVVLMPLDGSKARVFAIPGDVYFVHVVNCYENATSVILDIGTYDENPFIFQSSLRLFRNKTARDALTANKIERWVMHISGPRAGLLDHSTLSPPGVITDFPQINRGHSTAAYCLYWAIEWKHDFVTYASMAIVRQDVCSGERSYWHREDAYPSEVTFVPRSGPNATGAEDDGVLLFTLLDGKSGSSSLMLIDAATMANLDEIPLNATIPFTTHGEWYEGLLA